MSATRRVYREDRAQERQSEERSPVLDVLGRRGQPLPEETRAEMEGLFGVDLGDVQIHTDVLARRGADAIGARAFTAGDDIAFAAGQFNPKTGAGRELLAHELAHVIQQRRGPVETGPAHGGIALSGRNDRFERAASESARYALSPQGSAPPATPAPATASTVGAGEACAGGVVAVQPVRWWWTKDDDLKTKDTIKTPEAKVMGGNRHRVGPGKNHGKGRVGTDEEGASWKAYDDGGQGGQIEAKGKLYAQAGAKAVTRGGTFEADASAKAVVGGSAEAKGRWGDSNTGAFLEGGASADAKLSADARAALGGGLLKSSDGKTATGVYGHIDAEAGLGIEGNLRGSATGGYKGVKFNARGGGRAGAQGRAKAGVAGYAGLQGVGVRGQASAKATAEAATDLTVEFTAGDFAAELGGEIGADAFAKAEALGHVDITPTGIRVGGAAQAGVAAGVSASGTAAAKMYGRSVISATGGVGAHVGYTYGASGYFEMRGGKLSFSVGAGGSALLPAGLSANVNPTVDFKPVAVAILRQAYGLNWRLNGKKNPKTVVNEIVAGHTSGTPSATENGLTNRLRMYGLDKEGKLATNTSENYVKLEKVQQFIEKMVPVKYVQTLASQAEADAVDAMIVRAIQSALRPKLSGEFAGQSAAWAQAQNAPLVEAHTAATALEPKLATWATQAAKQQPLPAASTLPALPKGMKWAEVKPYLSDYARKVVEAAEAGGAIPDSRDRADPAGRSDPQAVGTEKFKKANFMPVTVKVKRGVVTEIKNLYATANPAPDPDGTEIDWDPGVTVDQGLSTIF